MNYRRLTAANDLESPCGSNRKCLTIITSTLNCRQDFLVTAASVGRQNTDLLQWIVADGASTDGTLEICSQHQDLIDVLLSSPDKGIYQAWNRAIPHINGRWVMFLGAGDAFSRDNIVAELCLILNELDDEYSLAFSDIVLSDDGTCYPLRCPPDLNAWDLGLPALPPHPGTVARSSLFRAGLRFDDSYRIAADSKFLLSALRNGHRYTVIPIVSVVMQGNGVCRQPRHWRIVQNEKRRIRNELEIPIPPFYRRPQDIKLYAKSLMFSLLGEMICIAIGRLVRAVRVATTNR